MISKAERDWIQEACRDCGLGVIEIETGKVGKLLEALEEALKVIKFVRDDMRALGYVSEDKDSPGGESLARCRKLLNGAR